MTDDSEKSPFRYQNKNTGQIVGYDQSSPRLEYLQNWVTLTADGQDTPEAAEYSDEKAGTRSGRGNLLGSSNVGDRVEPHHQVPPGTYEPEVETDVASPKRLTGDNKRDFTPQVLPENLSMNPLAHPADPGRDEGVMARAHPEMEGVEEQRQQLIADQQASRDPGDPDAGHPSVLGGPVDPNDHSTDGKGNATGKSIEQEPNPANRPPRSAPKSSWIDWAVECGSSREDAEEMTKQELIDVYGDDE